VSGGAFSVQSFAHADRLDAEVHGHGRRATITFTVGLGDVSVTGSTDRLREVLIDAAAKLNAITAQTTTTATEEANHGR
jgi:hypothetical protein